MINGRLTAAEAAERLGVKPATLYAYVSRGLLPREKTPSGSTFDPHDVARLARSGRQAAGSGPSGARGDSGTEPLFVTSLTLIEGGRLYYRGIDAVRLSRERSFEEVAAWLWAGEWPERPEPWVLPGHIGSAIEQSTALLRPGARPLERFMVAVAAGALADDLRHDLSAPAVAVIGRGLAAGLVESLPRPGRAGAAGRRVAAAPIAERLWRRLSPLKATAERSSLLDAALVLSADHELAPSTMAARVAASFRADLYAVVSTGLGPASGSWDPGSTGAPTEVETLLEECLRDGPERAVGERMRRTGTVPHGFGMPLYPDGDPRGAELLSRLDAVGGARERHDVVARVLQIAEARGFPPPNVDLGLGALSFCSSMPTGSGQAVATLGKVAGWLAHALEEYESPSRFRSRGYYVGPRPEVDGAPGA